MSNQTATFNEVVENNFSTLDLYTTAITRAHGENHPEAFEVRELFEVMNEKIKETGANNVNLDEEFTRMRDVTDNYTIPGDVCETYAGVYNMLSEADKSYHS
ncbi:MAG TPA: iron-sulfur cluster repair di-iron protein, ric [Virgibacillus sp.]|nr:iron-sulfur cluster repair di-iron protein, ric [Virgibacillus sp.]HLR65522.1 iron-sulfur cluster repair di-iron protein, ric [Virgibacillus sp.]